MWGKGGPIYSFIDGQDSHLIWQHNQGDSWNTYPENMALAEFLNETPEQLKVHILGK